MYIDDALRNVLRVLNTVLIPASESAKLENVKLTIRDVISTVENNRRAKAQEAAQKSAEEEKHED